MVKYNNRIKKFFILYESLTLDSLPEIDQLYSSKMVFRDPVHTIENREAFKEYFTKLLEPLNECTFEIHSFLNDEDNSFVCWTMKFSHQRFYKAKAIEVDGCSHLKWDQDQITFHRDYFDLGQMIYEKIPYLGRLILWIKGRLK